MGKTKLVIIADSLDRIVPIIQEDGRTNHDRIFKDYVFKVDYEDNADYEIKNDVKKSRCEFLDIKTLIKELELNEQIQVSNNEALLKSLLLLGSHKDVMKHYSNAQSTR